MAKHQTEWVLFFSSMLLVVYYLLQFFSQAISERQKWWVSAILKWHPIAISVRTVSINSLLRVFYYFKLYSSHAHVNSVCSEVRESAEQWSVRKFAILQRHWLLCHPTLTPKEGTGRKAAMCCWMYPLVKAWYFRDRTQLSCHPLSHLTKAYRRRFTGSCC